jgi:hypoxanthine phosphoribosyltransferase
MSELISELSHLFDESRKVLAEADCLFSRDEVDSAFAQLANSISEKLSDTNPVVLCIMNGGIVPMGMLVTRLDFPMQIDYLHATRYRNKIRGSELKWIVTPTLSLKHRIVLLVDDIHDEGVTLEEIKQYCLQEGAQKVYSAVLVNKQHGRKNNTNADFVGLDIPDRYVFGFGMDYKGLLRNASGIYAVKGL